MADAQLTRPLAGRTVLAIFAHPDDESLACGGTLARLADAGVRVVLLCASRGESGSVSDPALVPDGDLGRVRDARAARGGGGARRRRSDHAAIIRTATCAGTHVPELHARDRRADPSATGPTR